MPPPRKRSAPAPVPIEETVDPELTVMPALGEQYRKQAMPSERVCMKCGECGSECYICVDDAASYDEKATADLFVSRGGSYKPPLCGFCKRRRDRARQAEKAAA